MKKKKLWWSLLIVMAGFFALFFYGLFWASDPKEVPSPLEGKKAPDFTFIDMFDPNAPPFPLSSLTGKKMVFINFWASWCIPCIEESQEIEAAYKQNPGAFEVLTLAFQDTTEAVAQFRQKYKLTYPMAIDLSNKISLDYGVTGVPESYFVSPDGVILKKVVGTVKREDFLTYLQ